MPNQWYAQIMGNEIGPVSGGQLKQLADQKRITPDDQVRKGASGKWVSANHVKGLFDTPIEQPEDLAPLSPQLIPEMVLQGLSKEADSPPPRLTCCPDCDRQISKQAVTCPHCGRQIKAEIHYEQRSRGLAIALAWFFGPTGAHRHYMREDNGWFFLLGTVLLFGIPFVAFFSILDGFRYLSAEDEYFKITPIGSSLDDPEIFDLPCLK